MNEECYELIPSFRQKYFNIYINENNESIHDFIQTAHDYLSKDLEYETSSELFSAVSTCFSRFPEKYLPFLNEFLDKSRLNANYIYITATILFELIHNEIQLDAQCYQSFVDDSLKEVIPQLSNENDQIIIFSHQIRPQFINNLILNLFFISKITKELFLSVFPYIFTKNFQLNNQKFEIILQKLLKSGYIQLNSLTDASNSDLLEIFSHDLKIPNKIDEKTLLFFSMAIIFTKNGGEMEINGLSTENVVPFTALTILYHKKHFQKMSFLKINGLFLNSISQNDNSPVFNPSIDIILNNLEYLFDHDLFSVDSILQIIIILLKKLINNEFFANKNLLLSIFINYSNYNLADSFKKFIDSNQTVLFDLIFHHLSENECNIYYSLNLEIFDSNLLIEHVNKLTNTDEIIKTLHAIDNYCTKVPDLSLLSEFLQRIFNEKVESKKWDDAIFLNKFMKKYKIPIDLQEIKEISIPKTVNQHLFEVDSNINENDDIDNIIAYLLIDSHCEDNQKFEILLNKMIKDKNIYNNYILYSSHLLSSRKLRIRPYLKFFINEYEQNPDDFMNIVNSFYFFDVQKNVLIFKSGYSYFSLPNSEFGFSIVSKLLDSVSGNSVENYSVFLCLKNIAKKFPFLFNKDYQRLFDITLQQLDSFHLIFEQDLNEKSSNLLKTGYLALFTVLLSLNSPFILEKFLDWLFNSIRSFSDSQIFGLFLILLKINDPKILNYVYSKIVDFNFIEICKNLLQREIQNKTFQIYFTKNICKFISNVYTHIIECIFTVKDESKYENIIPYSKINSGLNVATFNFINDSEHFSKQVAEFIFKINTARDKNKDPTILQINDFNSKIYKVNDIKISKETDIEAQKSTIIKTPKPMKKKSNKKDNPSVEKINTDKNIEHLLIPIFANLLNILTCPSLNFICNDILCNIFNLFNESDDYISIVSNTFIKYLKEFSTNEIGSESFLSLKTMHQLFTIFEKIIDFRIEDKDFFYPYIDDFLNIIMLPKWRIDTSLILRFSFLLTRLYILPIRTTQFITNKDNIKMSSMTYLYNSNIKNYNKLIIQLKNSLHNEDISLYRFPGNVGINNMTSFYSYILIDNNHYDNKINKNIEGRIEYEKVEILNQYINTFKYFYTSLFMNKYKQDEDLFLFFSNFLSQFECSIKYKKYEKIIIMETSAVTFFLNFSMRLISETNIKWLAYHILKKGTELGNIDFALTCYRLIVNFQDFFLNKEKSYKYLRKAAEAGNKSAIIEIAKMLNKSKKSKTTDKIKFFKMAMNLSSRFKYSLGVSLIENGDMENGKRLIIEAANDGFLKAVSYVHYEYRKEHDLLESSPEIFEKEASKYKQILLDYKEDNSKVFVDENFPHLKNWKRIDEIYDAPLFQKDLIDPCFINQGAIGDCYLISAFTRIAKQYYLVPLLFERKLPNSILGNVKNSINIKCGAVVIYFQAFGRKLPVLIDTYIPANEAGKLLSSTPSDKSKSPWFCLVEKAFAKLNGSYGNIYGGFFNTSIYSLFFYIPSGKCEIPSFDYIMEKQKEGCLMTTSVNAKNIDSSNVDLHSKHCYLVMKARSYKNINLILVFNPWGHTDFDGKYSRSSEEWTLELKKAFNYDYYPDNAFWISYEEFSKYFNMFNCAKPINPEYHIKMAHCKLESLPFKIPKREFINNIELEKGFVIHIKDKIPFDKEIPFYFIVERRNSVFTNSIDHKEKSSRFMLFVEDSNNKKNRAEFYGRNVISAFNFNIRNTNCIRFIINRYDDNKIIQNFYINIVCKYNFEVTDAKGSSDLIRSINNPGIVFENYTLSNPEISKKLKLKIFDKKFILSLDDDEKSSELSSERDEQIEKLFNYVNKDFSSSYINLNELFTFDKSLIGSGTHSNVFIVNDKMTNKQYAAKILKYSINEMPVQFLNELMVLRSLRYPSIIKFIGFSDKNFQNENYPTIITEYLKNGSLLNLLIDVHKGTKELSNTKKMMILIGIALGIEYLHNHGIIHCDLKLENILMDDNLNPKICDFGNSKPLTLDTNNNIGTPLYMAPEVINGQPNSFPSDVFSFGVIAYFIYTDQIPNVNEPITISDSLNKYAFLNELLDENPENRPTFQQIVSSFLTEREKTWLENVNEDEIEKYLHIFGLTIKSIKINIDYDFIRSINVEKYPENAKQPKMTIDEIMSNEIISLNIKNDIKSAENYLKTEEQKDIDFKKIRKLLFNVGYQFCMGDKEATGNIQEDYFYAIKYLKEAALLGHKTSLYLLATLFSNNESNDNQETIKIALKLAEIAADMGSPEAFNLLGVFYKNGVAVQSNIIMAAIYFKIAADRKVVSAMFQFANIMMQIGNKEIASDEFNKQLETAEKIIHTIDGKSNKVYKEIRYTLEAIENNEVALFVSEKYFEKAAKNGNEEAENILKKVIERLSDNQDHPEFYNDLCQSLSIDQGSLSIDC